MGKQSIEDVAEQAELLSYIDDLPRIIRSDMTRMTEMLAKYRGIQIVLSEINPEAALALQSVVQTAMQLRAALLAGSSEIQSVQQPTGIGGHSVEELRQDLRAADQEAGVPEAPPPAPQPGEQLDSIDCEGRSTLLTTVLVKANFVTNTGAARKLIRAGELRLNKRPVSNTAHLLEPGKYLVQIGDATPVELRVN